MYRNYRHRPSLMPSDLINHLKQSRWYSTVCWTGYCMIPRTGILARRPTRAEDLDALKVSTPWRSRRLEGLDALKVSKPEVTKTCLSGYHCRITSVNPSIDSMPSQWFWPSNSRFGGTSGLAQRNEEVFVWCSQKSRHRVFILAHAMASRDYEAVTAPSVMGRCHYEDACKKSSYSASRSRCSRQNACKKLLHPQESGYTVMLVRHLTLVSSNACRRLSNSAPLQVPTLQSASVMAILVAVCQSQEEAEVSKASNCAFEIARAMQRAQ